MLHIQELVYDATGGRYVADRLCEMPLSVMARNLQDYCRQTYGAPLDVATSIDGDGGEAVVGWSYELSTALSREFGLTDGELIVIPLVTAEDGELRPLLLVLLEQHRMFELLQDERRVDEVVLLPADEGWTPETPKSEIRPS